jgi:excisionase family DNA binding protein
MRPIMPDPALDGYGALIPSSTVAREILHISPRTLRRWLKRGRLGAGVLRTATTGGRVLIRREAVGRLLAQLEGKDVE